MTALIVGSVLGAVDFAQYARAKPGRCASDPDIPALLLLDLLATKGGN